MCAMTRILFVDDEARVLDGIRDLLRKYRTKWDLHFALGGEAAMKLIAEQPFDVVVTDIRMPKIDGLMLLKHLEQHHPETVRIVLSGDPGRDTAMNVVRHAHQALTKPCRLGELEAALTSACKLRELVADEEVRRVLGRVELPQLPKTYQRLVQVLEDPRTGPPQIAEVLSADIAVSAKVLRLANSAIFGGRRQVTSVAQAIAVIGTETIKGLVLADAVAKKAQIPALIQVLVEDLQEHSLLVARVAAEVAGSDPVARRDAFSAGMLHDVGRLVLALEMPEVVDARTAVIRGPGAVSANSVSGSGHHAHARIGGYLLGLWGLPLGIIEAVANHHEMPTAESSAVAVAIKVAEEIIAEVAAVQDRATAEEVETIMKLAAERGRELVSRYVAA